jgi:WD40 repeat protein
VTCLEFHPREPFLASGSSDFTIKIFDYSKASGTVSYLYLNMLYPTPFSSGVFTADPNLWLEPVLRICDILVRIRIRTGSCYFRIEVANKKCFQVLLLIIF